MIEFILGVILFAGVAFVIYLTAADKDIEAGFEDMNNLKDEALDEIKKRIGKE